MEKVNTNFDFFINNIVSNFKHMLLREVSIFLNDEYVYKIYHDDVDSDRKSENVVEKAANLDAKYITTPLEMIYFNNEFYGYKMPNGGLSLLDFLKNNEINRELCINILNQLKNIVLYLQGIGVCHGDIRFTNVVYKDGVIRLIDVNNMVFPGEGFEHSNNLYNLWYMSTDNILMLDNLACNLICYLLFTFSSHELVDIIENKYCFDPFVFYDIVGIDKGIFDKEIFDTFKSAFLCGSKALKKLNPDTFLIDYLK